MSNPKKVPISEQIEQVASLIETAQRLIYQSKVVDVQAIEAKTADLCEALEKLPPNQSKDLLPMVEKLFKSIDQLEKDLNMQHDALTERLKLSEPHANPLFAQEVSHDDDGDD